MRPVIRLAGGLAGGTLLLLACASVSFAADPLVTIDGAAKTTDGADGSATVKLGAAAPTTTGGAHGSATVKLGAAAPTTTDGADGSATVKLGAAAPTTTDGADRAPSGPDGSGGFGGSSGLNGPSDAPAAARDTNGATLPETSTEAHGSKPTVGFPILALLLSLLAGGLRAQKQSARSAR